MRIWSKNHRSNQSYHRSNQSYLCSRSKI